MRSKKIAAALLLIAMACCFWAARSARQARESLAALSLQHTRIEAEVQQATIRSAAAEQKLADLQRPTTGITPTRVGSATIEKAPVSRPPSSQRELISTDPKLEVLSLKWQRAVIALEYAPLYRALGLSSEQIESFEENHHRYTELSMDVAAVAQTKDEAGKQTAATLQEQAKLAYEAAQKELLGPEGFQQEQEYIRTLVPRNVIVLGLAGTAAFEGVPLTAQQGEQLWQAALKLSRADANAKGMDFVTTLDWAAFDEQARQILTLRQFELFKTVAPPSGFDSRWTLQSSAAMRRAQQLEAPNSGLRR